MKDGRSVDTTMSFTALDGLVMGTRSGNLDPGVILYLEQQHGMSAKAVEHLLYNESGLLGVSGFSSDMRVLLASSDSRAREAIALFVFRIAREIGAMAASLDGVDGIVFTAGIGENSSEVRSMIAARLGWLGAVLDQTANAQGASLISKPESHIKLYIIPTSEETMIARHTLDIVRPA
jgi:acetate kinase